MLLVLKRAFDFAGNNTSVRVHGAVLGWSSAVEQRPVVE